MVCCYGDMRGYGALGGGLVAAYITFDLEY